MIGLRDAFILATTKLRTRKIRLGITIVISGLLFGALVAGSLGSNGIFGSVDSFAKEGFGSRYVVSGFTQNPMLFNNPDVIARAKALYTQVVADKKAEAKKLGIEYDPVNEPKPVNEVDLPQGKESFLNFGHPLAKQAQEEYLVTHPFTTMVDFKTEAQKYGAEKFYMNRWVAVPDGTQIKVLKDGQESYDDSTDGKQSYDPNGIDSFTSQWGAMSDELLETFILPGESLTTGADGSVPIVIPYAVAQQFLKLTSLPGGASAEARLERLKYVRTHLKNTSYQACYRNQTSLALVEDAKLVQRQIADNKKNKDYQKPRLIYGLPTQPCGAAPIIRDVRAADEKKLAAKQLQFAQTFGEPQPEQAIVTFRVVGISPDVPTGNFSRIDQIFNSIVQSSLGNGWFMPESQLDSNPILAKLFAKDGSFSISQPPNYFAEFTDPGQEQKYIDERSCGGYDFDKCRTEGTPFTVTPYGSNSIAMASIKHKANKALNLAALGVIIGAAIIMMGTVGRMVADSRRETAIFRAIGAKRRDISTIYILYTVLLSMMIALFALLSGFLVATYLDDKLSAQLTAQALVSYNAQDMNRVFTVFGVNMGDLLRIVGCVVLAGLISATIPLLRNVRRNPIRDMRDEN